MKIIFVAMLVLSSNVYSIDYEDCLYRVEKLKKSARNADDTASGASGRDALQEIHSALDEVDSALSKAKNACESNSSSKVNYTEYCNRIASISRLSGKKEAENLCRAYQTGYVLNLCLGCAGVTNH